MLNAHFETWDYLVFGLYAVDIVNGAQALSDISIPGLTARTAEEIKALVTRRLNGNGEGH